MTRSAVAWTKLECDGVDVEFCQHWGGLVEIICGASRVMVCYCGLERLAKLPPESAVLLLIDLLKVARVERRNSVQAELLTAVLERRVHGAALPTVS